MGNEHPSTALRLVEGAVGSAEPVSLTGWEVLSVREAARVANLSPDTILNWCKSRGIGRQLKPGSPWRVSGPALRMLMACDVEALATFRARGFKDPAVRPYLLPNGAGGVD